MLYRTFTEPPGRVAGSAFAHGSEPRHGCNGLCAVALARQAEFERGTGTLEGVNRTARQRIVSRIAARSIGTEVLAPVFT